MTAQLEIVKIAGLAVVQDGGRPGRMHEGIPPGGALCPERLHRANIAVRNERTAAAIEVSGELVVVAHGDVTVASDDGSVVALAAGAKFHVRAASLSRVGYLAVRGAFDVPVVLGGRGTLLVASLGGFQGRVLRAGDILPVGDAPPVVGALPPRVIRVIRGPDLGDDAWQELMASVWKISPSSDRVGTRLIGRKIPREQVSASKPSMPMVRGAIEIPPSGEPIVLGPDQLTVGGHPILGVVSRVDLGKFHEVPLGGKLVFAPVSLEDARVAYLQATRSAD